MQDKLPRYLFSQDSLSNSCLSNPFTTIFNTPHCTLFVFYYPNMKFLLASATLAAVFSTVVMAAPTGNERRQNYFTSAHYDDQDSVVSYTGNWTHVTSENFQLQSKTESCSKTPNA